MSNKSQVRIITLDFWAGASIADACTEAVGLATLTRHNVHFSFNGVALLAIPDMRPADLVSEYWIADLSKQESKK